METSFSYRLLLFAIVVILGGGVWGCRQACLPGNGVLKMETRDVAPFQSVVADGDFQVVVRQDSQSSVKVEGDANLIDYIKTETINGVLTLSIKGFQCMKTNKPMRVYVTAPVFQSFKLTGSGSFAALTPLVLANELKCESSGSGAIVFEDSVKTPLFSLTLSGSGSFDAPVCLKSETLSVKSVGSGSASLSAQARRFDSQSSGSGVIHAWGQTDELNIKSSGSGSFEGLALRSRLADVNVNGSGAVALWVDEKLDVTLTGSGSVRYKGPAVIGSVNVTGSGSLQHID